MAKEVKEYLVGSVSLTDNKASLEITGRIEETIDGDKNYCDPVFLITINPYAGKFVSMKLNNIEMRATVQNFLLYYYGKIKEFQRQSGGRNSQCFLKTYKRSTYDYIGLIRGENSVEISFKEHELLGLVKELENLCDALSDALFKTQQMIARKKAKKQKKKEQENG
ncbi:MAG: hypothetical protein IE878_06580 [Epsilonproteobacteria bacterium]|nr:hypothetical protein [Campylobacterota bacterium]